jgi:hypothetical protein
MITNNDFKIFGTKYNTDKINTHGYHRFYDKELNEYRDMKSIGILEIGIQNGESLSLWKDYFPYAFIYGIDINIDYNDERCKIFKADQSNLEELKIIKSNIKDKIYFINDDGSHIPEHQLLCFDYLFLNLLEEGGTYIIEDIETSYWKTGNIYGYNTNYGMENYSSIVEKFKLLIDYVNYNFLSDYDKNLLNKKTDFLSNETKNKILSINFSQNCIIIKKKTNDDFMYHDTYYYKNEVSNNNLDNCQIVIKKSEIDGLGNVLKGFISASAISNNVVIECNPTYIYGNYDTILDNKYIYDHLDNKKNEYVYTCRLLVLKEEEEYQENILNEYQYSDSIGNDNLNHHFSSNKLIDWNYDEDKIYPIIKNRIINTIDKIIFKNIILNEVELLKKIMISNENENLGISVRTWKASHENNINRPYDFNIYKNEILSIIEKNKNIKNVILSFDNNNYIDDYINLFNNLKNINLFILNKKGYLNDLQFSTIKVLLLSKFDYLIGNRLSTYTELIFWFSKCKIKVTPLI